MRDPDDKTLRRTIVETARAMADAGLSPGTTGNVSVRADAFGAMLITPSGVTYGDLDPSRVVRVERDGTVPNGTGRPSTEWPLHQAIYRAFTDAQAIVHCHSPSATALSCTHRDIPAFHYMVSAAGGSSVRCAPYATFGTPEMGRVVVPALEGRRACLMANHGQVAFGADAAQALALAIQIEALAAQYVQVLSIGGARILDGSEMERVRKQFEGYGQ